MEGKYGRLFTETDLLDAIQGAYELGILGAKGGATIGDGRHPGLLDVLAQHPFEPTFPADEPLFLLRGQDKAAPDAIASTRPESTGIDYAQSSLNAGAPQAHLAAIWRAAAAMRDWQEANPERVKVPD